MADKIYTLQTPDGRTVDISGPEGATAEQLGAAWMADPRSKQPAINPTAGMPIGDLLAAGAGKAVADTGLGLRQLGGMAMDYLRPNPAGQPSRSDILNQEVAETRRRDAPLMDTAAGMVGNIGGNVASALLPGGVAVQGAKQLSKIPAAARLAEMLMAGGKTMMAPTTIPTALGVGAVQGAVQPALTTGERAGNIALGAAGSAAVPAGIRGYQFGRSVIDPLTEAGQTTIVGRALNNAAGSPESAAAARGNLNAAMTPFVGPTPENEVARTVMGEIVPGSMPTTAQAAGVPSIAALSRSASAVDPQSINATAQRAAEQQAARLQQMRGVAGSEGGRDFAAANRQVVGNQMYENARKIGVDPAALTPEAQANISNFMQRVPDDVLSRAKDLAKIKGIDLDNSTSVQGMHWVKTAIDDKINSAVRSGDKQLASAYTGLQQDLLSGLDQMSPAYQAARQEYSAMSKPINSMDTAQAVLDSSTPNKSTGQITPAAFAKALSDKTAANATGRSSATLENTVYPRDLQKMQAVNEDLGRQLFADTAGKGGGSDTAQKLAFSNMMQQSGLPGWINPQMLLTGLGTAGGAAIGGPLGAGGGAALGALTKAGARQVYQDANTEMSRKLAQALLDPQTAIQMMDAGMINPQTVQAINGVRRLGSGAGAMAPALLNSFQGSNLGQQ